MEERFKAVLNNYSTEGALPKTILAVSGGIDSVAMVYLYKASGLPFSIAHCNFQLRGEDSDRDEIFVMQLGEKLAVKVMVNRFDTDTYASENSLSIQMAARNLRYAWFRELAIEFGAKVAVAHHANDVAETMLFNLAKGTGIAGLHGIADDDGIFIRPLLWATKEEIVDFAQKKGFEWREDDSNTSEKYMRNIIRKKIVPVLQQINPSFVATNLRTAARIKDTEEFILHTIEQLGIIEEREEHIYINKEVLVKLPGSRTVLYQLIKVYGFSYEQVISIDKSYQNVGAVFMSGSWVLNVDRDYLIISPDKPEIIEKFVSQEEKLIDLESFSLQTKQLDAGGYQIIPDNKVASLDLKKLAFPLLIRNWQQGDYFSPLGMKGRKKVSDFLIDAKIPINLKRQVLVLISEHEIVWVIGYRINEHYKITSQTKQVYQVELVP